MSKHENQKSNSEVVSSLLRSKPREMSAELSQKLDKMFDWSWVGELSTEDELLLSADIDWNSYIDSVDTRTEVTSSSLTIKYSDWLNTEEAAAFLGISKDSLYNMTSAGAVPYSKLGGRNRYKADDFNQLLLENRKGVVR